MDDLIKELHSKILEFFADRAERIDNTIKSDSRAIDMFTRLEKQQINEEKIINDFVALYNTYMPENLRAEYI